MPRHRRQESDDFEEDIDYEDFEDNVVEEQNALKQDKTDRQEVHESRSDDGESSHQRRNYVRHEEETSHQVDEYEEEDVEENHRRRSRADTTDDRNTRKRGRSGERQNVSNGDRARRENHHHQKRSRMDQKAGSNYGSRQVTENPRHARHGPRGPSRYDAGHNNHEGPPGGRGWNAPPRGPPRGWHAGYSAPRMPPGGRMQHPRYPPRPAHSARPMRPPRPSMGPMGRGPPRPRGPTHSSEHHPSGPRPPLRYLPGYDDHYDNPVPAPRPARPPRHAYPPAHSVRPRLPANGHAPKSANRTWVSPTNASARGALAKPNGSAHKTWAATSNADKSMGTKQNEKNPETGSGWNMFKKPDDAAPTVDSQVENVGNTELLIRNIPKEMCTVGALASYFSTFGTVMNLSMQPDNSAKVEFGSAGDAAKAYTSKEPILGVQAISKEWASAKGPAAQRESGSTQNSSKWGLASRGKAMKHSANNKWTRQGAAAANSNGPSIELTKARLMEKIAAKKLAVEHGKIAALKKEILDQKEKLNQMASGSGSISADEKTEVMGKVTSLMLQLRSTQAGIKNGKEEVLRTAQETKRLEKEAAIDRKSTPIAAQVVSSSNLEDDTTNEVQDPTR